MFQTVFVDVDNTLLDFQACARESMSLALAGRGIVCTDYMFDTFDRINDSLWLEVEKGSITRDTLYSVRFAKIFGELGLELPADEFEKQFRCGLDLCAVPFEGAEELMKYLHGKYTVCIASNAHQSQQESRLKRAGLLKYAHHLGTSEFMGAEKPGKAFFDACFALLPGAGPDSAVMLGDSLTADVQGAKNYGMAAIWFDCKNTNNPMEFHPDHTVHSLREVMDIL